MIVHLRNELARALVEDEGDNIVASLIRNQQELARWVEREIAWPIALSRTVLHQF